jgi:hypothetical protein
MRMLGSVLSLDRIATTADLNAVALLPSQQ